MTDTIGVVGLGTMGLGIAQVFAQAGLTVLATDATPGARASARDRLKTALSPRVAKGAMSAAECDAILSRLIVVETPDRLAPAQTGRSKPSSRTSASSAPSSRLWKSVLAPDAVIATNTSSSAGLRHCGRCAPPGTPARVALLQPRTGHEARGARAAWAHGTGRARHGPPVDRGGRQGGDRRAGSPRLHRQPLRAALLRRSPRDAGRRPHPLRDRRGHGRGGLPAWPLLADRPHRRRHQPCRHRRPVPRHGRASALSRLRPAEAAGRQRQPWAQDRAGVPLPRPARARRLPMPVPSRSGSRPRW